MMLAFHLLYFRAREQTAERGTFLLNRVAQFITYLCSFFSLWILVSRFNQLGDWNSSEIVFLFGLQLLGYALGASISFAQMRDLGDVVRKGEFDLILVKPVGTWTYFAFSRFSNGYTSHVALSALLIVFSLRSLGGSIGWLDYLLLVYFTVNSMVIVASLITIVGSLSIGGTETRYIYTTLFSLFEISKYPNSIFPGLTQFVLMVIPVGFAGYVPAAILLGKEVPLLGDYALPVTVLAGPVFLALAAWQWKRSLSFYEGTRG